MYRAVRYRTAPSGAKHLSQSLYRTARYSEEAGKSDLAVRYRKITFFLLFDNMIVIFTSILITSSSQQLAYSWRVSD
jgi:hypothetical protein